MTTALEPARTITCDYEVHYNPDLNRWFVLHDQEVEVDFDNPEETLEWLVRELLAECLDRVTPDLEANLNAAITDRDDGPAADSLSVVLSYDTVQTRWLVWTRPWEFVGHTQVITHSAQVAFETAAVQSLKMWLWYHELAILTMIAWSDAERLVSELILEQAPNVPYPQDCQCQNPEHGLMANDCHARYANGRPHTYREDRFHFILDLEITCCC